MISKSVIRNICLTTNFNGNVLISKGNDILFEESFGYNNITEKTPFNLETCFRIGSITKQVTAVAILQLVDKGLLSLEDPLSRWFDTPYDEVITIHNLLANNSGIPNFPIDGDYDQYLETGAFHKHMIYDVIFKQPLHFSPGNQFEYSSSGFLILSHIIELVSGMKYHEYLQENLFKALDMNRTGFHFIDQEIKNFSHLYDKQEDTIVAATPYDMRKASGAGGLYSCTRDLHKWGYSLINHTMISKELRDKMFSVQTPINEQGGYGYGIISFKDEGHHEVIYHPGNGPGVFAQNMILDRDVQIILLSNINDGQTFRPCFQQIRKHITETLL